MFDVGDLPALTFGNCVLKTGVIKWPLKLYVTYVFYVFLQNPKKTRLPTFLVVAHVFSNTACSGDADCYKLLVWHTKTFSKLETLALPSVTSTAAGGAQTRTRSDVG